MRYVQIPKEISLDELYKKQVLSPSLYQEVTCPNQNTEKIQDLVDDPIKGEEVGSVSYVEKSDYYFIRTRSLKNFSFILQIDNESPVPIKPTSFIDYKLSKLDILYSKDSNIGECCIVESESYKKYMISAGILKLVAKKNPLYLFAFLKHPFVKSQLYSITSRGSTMRHSKLKVLSCFIPFPNGSNVTKIISHVEKLVDDIITIESSIKQKDDTIYQIICDELKSNQTKLQFNYKNPTIGDIRHLGRLDAGMYSKEFKKMIFSITNYVNGFHQLVDPFLNFDVKPGPSLEFKIIKTRVDSDEPKDGYYTLLIPTDISEYGTLDKLRYMGTAKQIEGLKFGDVLMGESGTWRSLVLLSNYEKCITNAHGNRLRQRDGKLQLSIFVRCILSWYKRTGLFNFMAVGGSGGHLSPKYFEHILIPDFPDNVQKKIVELYYNHDTKSGTAQLNERRLILTQQLDLLIDKIINDEHIDLTKFE